MKQIKEQLLYRKDIWWKLNKQEELEFPQLISECKKIGFQMLLWKSDHKILYRLQISERLSMEWRRHYVA